MTSKRKHPQRRRPRPPSRNPCQALLSVVKELNAGSTPFGVQAWRIALARDHAAAVQQLRRLAPYYLAEQLDPDEFRTYERPPTGRIAVGQTANGPFGLSDKDCTEGVGCYGLPGMGKTVVATNTATQCCEQGIPGVWLDRKRETAGLAREGLIPLEGDDDFFLNPYCPPHSAVDIRPHRNLLSRAFSEQQNFMLRGESMYTKGVDLLYQRFRVYELWPHWPWGELPFPMHDDLLALFKSSEFRRTVAPGPGRHSLESIIAKMERLKIECGHVLNVERGISIDRLVTEKRFVTLMVDGWTSTTQTYIFLTLLLHYYEYLLAVAQRHQLNAVFMLDEAHDLLGQANKDLGILHDLLVKRREIGLSVFIFDQEASGIAQGFSSLGTVLWMRSRDGRDVRRLREATGATYAQAMQQYRLAPFEAIVRTTRADDLFQVKIPFTPREKVIPNEERRRLIKPILDDLHRDVIQRSTTTTPPRVIAETDDEFLRALCQNCLRSAKDVYDDLKMSSSSGHAQKIRLTEQGLISILPMNLGRRGTRSTVMIPSRDVFEHFGMTPGPGMGEPIHRGSQQRCKEIGEAFECDAVIDERPGPTREAADVGLTHRRTGKRVAVENCVWSKPNTEVSNIDKTLNRLGYDHVVLCFVHKRTRDKVERLARTQYSSDVLARVTCCTVGEVERAIAEALA